MFSVTYLDTLYVINCTCMGRFDNSGTSKNDNSPKVLVGHGVKKYGIEIFLEAYRLRYAYLFTFYSTLKNQ